MNELPEREVAIFNAARRLAGGERAAYLDEACAGNAALRRRLDELLRVDEGAGDFLEKPALAEPNALAMPGGIVPPAIPLSEKPGDRIGPYKLLQQIGEGGCGVVYMAEQETPIRRRVALKVIKLGMDTKQVIARFEAERQALALMDHPNIARVLDAGATETGRPYFVMELVRGTRITDYCDQQSLPTRERLGLFIKVCQAIQHAHQKGIIHRDIKPSNILVTINDGVAVPKVIDFGIAKATQGRLTDLTLFTAFEQFIGTPAYMSPEQAVLTSLDVDTRSDIYSLGVLLYELLTGQTPFDSKELLAKGLDELRRTIREQEPRRPSNRLTTMDEGALTTTAQRRQTDPPKLVHLVQGDLDWIVMKCLEKDRSRRYETANGLVFDLVRHLHNEPVLARPPSNWYRFQKMARRNKLAFGAASVVAATLFLGVIVSSWEAVRARQAEREQRRLRATAQSAQAKEAQMRQRAEAGETAARRNGYASDMIAANNALEDGNFGLTRRLLNQHQPRTNEEDLRGFEWRYLWGRSRGEQLKTFAGHSNYVNCVAYSPDGMMLVSGSSDHTVKLWNATTGELIATCAGHSNAVISVAFAPNGKFFASGGLDKRIRLWDRRTHQIVLTITNHAPFLAFSERFLALTTDGDIYGKDGGTIQLWNYTNGQMVADLPESGNRAAFSSDGKTLATANWQGSIKLWNLDDLRPFRTNASANVTCMSFSPDGKTLAWSGADAHLWDLTNNSSSIQVRGTARIHALAFSPDGQNLATVTQEHDIIIWSVSGRQVLRSMRGHGNEVFAVAYSPDGKRLATASRDDTVMLWDPSSELAQDSLTNISMSRWIHAGLPVFSPDGRTLAAATRNEAARSADATPIREDLTEGIDRDGGVRFWDTASWQVNSGPKAGGFPIAYSRDGRNLLSRDGPFALLQEWDVATQALITSVKTAIPDGRIYDAVVSPDGKMIAIAQRKAVVLISTATGERLFTISQPMISRCLIFSPDNNFIGTGDYDFTARIWELKTRQVVWALTGFRDTVGAVAFSSNGLFAAGSWDGTIKVCDVNGKTELATLTGHKAAVVQLAFASDGRTLASGSDDGAVKLWNLPVGREVLSFKTEFYQYFVRFSPR